MLKDYTKAFAPVPIAKPVRLNLILIIILFICQFKPFFPIFDTGRHTLVNLSSEK